VHCIHRHNPNQIAGCLVLKRQRIAALPVTRAEPALEVHAPHVVGCVAVPQRGRAWSSVPPALARHRQALAPQQVPNRARRRPRLLRTGLLQTRLDLLRTPRRVSMTYTYDILAHFVAQRVRTLVRRVAPLSQTPSTALPPPRQYLIARLPA